MMYDAFPCFGHRSLLSDARTRIIPLMAEVAKRMADADGGEGSTFYATFHAPKLLGPPGCLWQRSDEGHRACGDANRRWTRCSPSTADHVFRRLASLKLVQIYASHREWA